MSQRHIAALDRVLELVVLLNFDMTGYLRKEGLTTSRTAVLWELDQRGPSTQRVLAEARGVSARTITGLVDGLESTGFVTREPHPGDRRATLVTPTARGTDILATMRREQGEFAALLFGDMPEGRFEGLVAGLDDLLERLRAAGLTVHAADEAADAGAATSAEHVPGRASGQASVPAGEPAAGVAPAGVAGEVRS
ncbi:MarR family transcriptional regulator [Longispora sp. NPDC051575]|uniref:MarR family winged helix-turn-helix transcriptional regulator n=1 Tax=Longispora sp. NPDC051575 TaxID=3154943 RepID=UPI00342C7554